MRSLLFNQIYHSRNQLVLKAFCHYKFELRSGFEESLSNFDHKRKLFFIHNPKAAGNSILEYLGLRTGDFKTSHSTPTFLAPKHIWENYQSIVVTRHPLDRLISSYTYHTKPEYSGVFKSKYPNLESLTIEEYFRTFIKEPFAIRPQVDYVTHALSDKPVDFILKLETLEEDLKHLSKCLEIENAPLVKKNTSERKGSDLLSNEDFKQEVIKYYSDDFDKFGYSRETLYGL